MRTVVIDASNAVVNAIEAGPDFTLPGFLLVPDERAGPGWSYDPKTGTFAPPAPPAQPVPPSVSQTQFMRAAVRDPFKLVTADEAEGYLGRGELPAFVVAALTTIPDEAARADARLTMIGATTFERGNALFALLIASGIATAEQVDALFQLADTLN